MAKWPPALHVPKAHIPDAEEVKQAFGEIGKDAREMAQSLAAEAAQGAKEVKDDLVAFEQQYHTWSWPHAIAALLFLFLLSSGMLALGATLRGKPDLSQYVPLSQYTALHADLDKAVAERNAIDKTSQGAARAAMVLTAQNDSLRKQLETQTCGWSDQTIDALNGVRK